ELTWADIVPAADDSRSLALSLPPIDVVVPNPASDVPDIPAVPMRAIAADDPLLEPLLAANLANELLIVVRRFNQVRGAAASPLQSFLAAFQQRMDDSVDWERARGASDPVVRMQLAVREAAEDRFAVARDLAEPLWSDREYADHARLSPLHTDAY